MIDLDGMISIPYLKKNTFTGSEKEMNFMIRKEAGENGDILQAAAWPGPYIFSVTEDEKKTFQEFSFDNEGIRNAVDWLNRFYGENYGTDEEKGGYRKKAALMAFGLPLLYLLSLLYGHRPGGKIQEHLGEIWF